MNCKPGDLAIVVGARGTEPALSILRAAIGKVVKCIKIVPRRDTEEFRCMTDDNWELEQAIEVRLESIPDRVFYIEAVSDSILRPIRDSDEQDETLTWLEVPKSKKVILQE